MKKEINGYGKEKNCPNCGYGLKFSWLSGMYSPYIFFYSENSKEILVSRKLFHLFEDGNRNDEQFRLVVTEYLENRNLISKGFGLKNSLRCSNCSFVLSKRKDMSISQSLYDKAFYLDGMIFHTDNDVFEINIELS